MKILKIIINADDLGMSADVNDAIENAIKEGCISSSTIIANAPAFEDAIRIAKLYPHISFGLHLNIDEFSPLTESSVFAKNGMINGGGCFKKEYLLKTEARINDDLMVAIYNEWKAQIEKVIKAGVIPSHLDSHEHTHGIFDLQPILMKLMKEYGITKVRRQPYSSMQDMIATRLMHLNPISQSEYISQPVIKSAAKNHSFIYRRFHQLLDGYRHRQWIRDMKRDEITMTDFFEGYQMFCSCYPRLYKYKKMESVELMTHPGHPGYAAETEMLMKKEMMRICRYELINYNQL